MKGLIINHGTKYLPELKELFPEAEIVRYDLFDPINAEDYDFIVLSGGSINISGNGDIVSEKEFILKTNKPILGICLGHQIVGIAHGSKLLELNKSREELLSIEIMEVLGDIFYNHGWYIKDLPNDFILLAKDNEIISAMRHSTKPILTIQGHPEMSGEYGQKIRTLFMESFVKKNHTIN